MPIPRKNLEAVGEQERPVKERAREFLAGHKRAAYSKKELEAALFPKPAAPFPKPAALFDFGGILEYRGLRGSPKRLRHPMHLGTALDELVKEGEVRRERIDGVEWHATKKRAK
jgi:hypothetical protein